MIQPKGRGVDAVAAGRLAPWASSRVLADECPSLSVQQFGGQFVPERVDGFVGRFRLARPLLEPPPGLQSVAAAGVRHRKKDAVKGSAFAAALRGGLFELLIASLNRPAL